MIGRNLRWMVIAAPVAAVLITGCTAGKRHNAAWRDEAQKAQQLRALPITQGAIPEAMRWKKVTVLTPWVGETSLLLEFLKNLPQEETAGEIFTPPLGDIPLMEELHLYLLYGWSSSGRDEMRSITVDSATVSGAEIKIYVSRPEVVYEGPVMGTADMKFIGWDFPLGFPPGKDCEVLLYEKRDRVRVSAQPYSRSVEAEGRYQLKKKIQFNIIGVR